MIDGFHLYERERFLNQIDSHWKNHLYAMDHLKEGVHLEAYAQKDPKVIYKREGFELFKQLLDRIDQSIAETMIRVEIQGPQDVESIRQLRRSVAMHYGRGTLPPEAGPNAQSTSGSSMDESGPVRSSPGFTPKVGRNDPCPCGSGKKYKKCCLPKEMGQVPQEF